MNAAAPAGDGTLPLSEQVDAAHRACAELRFAEGLRRGWERARAEAAVQEAVTLAWMEGARGSATELRAMTMAGETGEALLPPGDAGAAQMLGIWRAAWGSVSSLPALNASSGPRARPMARPLPAVLAGINRDVCSFMVASGVVPSREVAVPTDPVAVRDAIAATAGGGTAVERAARVLQVLLTRRPFSHGNTATAFLFVKWLLSKDGVEPTAASVLSAAAGGDPQAFAVLLDEGTEAQWQAFLAQSLVQGCAAGLRVARSVQAGVTVAGVAFVENSSVPKRAS